MTWQWPSRLLTGLALVAATTSCAQEREPINRVQPMALSKSFFLGNDLEDTADDPEFYTQQFITDVPYGASQGNLWTVGFGGKLARVKFEVTEQYLIARITYERIDDSDGKGTDPRKRDGVIAATFPILSHFDIRRSYNQQTGEEMNIIEENDSDRPWHQREYFRVDWSRNLNTDSYDFDILADLGIMGGTVYEPLTYYVDDPSHPDAPHFAVEDGYFDVTTKAFAKPQTVDLSHFGWGIDSLPSCMLDNDFLGGSSPAGSCNPIEITMRLSFMKIKPTDYEPSNWDGYKFQAYGAFYKERYGYSDSYGMVDDKWRRFINRYNIWERSHYYDDPEAMTGAVACATDETTSKLGGDPHRDLARFDFDTNQWQDGANGTEDECELVTQKTGVAGSRCDEFTHKCTLPYRLRVAKPLAWYYTATDDTMIEDYFEPTNQAVHEWDVAIRSAVQAARYSECRRTESAEFDCMTAYPVVTGQQQDNEDAVALAHEVDLCRHRNGHVDQGGTEDCLAIADQKGLQWNVNWQVTALAKMPEMITLCHSPVRETDSPVCAPVGTVARLGDLRYHGINVHAMPQTPSPWGIMVDSTDPLTGETIMASANCFAFINDLWAQGLVDYVRYIRGELTTSDITEGTNVRDWARADGLARSGGGGVLPQVSKAQLHKTLAGMAGVTPAKFEELMALEPQLRTTAWYQLGKEMSGQARSLRASAEAPSQQRGVVEARLRHAHGSEFEAELMSQPVLERAGLRNMPESGELLDFASPLRLNNPQFELEYKRMKEQALANRGMCIMNEAPEGTGVTAIADILFDNKFPVPDNESANDRFDRIERMRRYLKRKAHYSVIIHEIGHSVGLRHNFVSSADAFGFRPQYWQLRTKNGAVTKECSDLVEDGSDCIGPRYHDPVTEEERINLQTMFMQSSVMDYSGTAEGDFVGLGVWDFAAARMFYGETVAVFDDDTYKMDAVASEPHGQLERSLGLLSKMDSFGGLVGLEPSVGLRNAESPIKNFHYSAYQKHYRLIRDCFEVNPYDFVPSDWDEAANGPWHPVLDGRIVQVDGKYTKCREVPVDHVFWSDLRYPTGPATTKGSELEEIQYYRGGPAIDPSGRVRVPYGFATDTWADLGNLSVYRHDLGADAYELFQFFISQQETRHIWDNYRRNRQSFSVRSASGRAFERYNAKMRDGAKGLGLLTNIYSDRFTAIGYDFSELRPFVMNWYEGNALASAMAFDHFTRQMARPHAGLHYIKTGTKPMNSAACPGGDWELTNGIFVPADDSRGNETCADGYVTIPNGATGYFRDVGLGGRPLNNALSETNGEYDSSFTVNAGSYYDKIYAPELLAESVDNFISDSRGDFYDSRYRAVSMADLFDDGYRRFIANVLTNDSYITGARLVADESGRPLVGADGYPEHPIAWTSWWPAAGPEVCVPGNGSTVCTSPGQTEGLDPNAPQHFAVIDPQVGWEQQKHTIAQTLLWLPENQQQRWLDMMTVWELGRDADPTFEQRIQFMNPVTGKTYVAKTYGTESIFGRDGLQKGIAARMLQYANELVSRAFQIKTCESTDDACLAALAPDLDGDGEPDWPTVMFQPDGTPIVVPDLGNGYINNSTGEMVIADACDQNVEPGCTPIACSGNRACVELQRYIEVIFFMRQAMAAYGLSDLSQKGVY